MEVESLAGNGELRLANVQSSLFFETPEELYQRVYRQVSPRREMPPIRVDFRPFANANSSIRLVNGGICVQISDLLEAAPALVLEALAFILLSKLYRKPVDARYAERYRHWLGRQEIRDRIHAVRQSRGRKSMLPPCGSHFDLEEIFRSVNQTYFFGLLKQPLLGWSLRFSRTRLGHYDPAHHVIVISRLLDRPGVPPLAVEYVMFHEALHIRYPEEFGHSRRRIHHPEFRRAERAFPRFTEAKRALRNLSRCG